MQDIRHGLRARLRRKLDEADRLAAADVEVAGGEEQDAVDMHAV